MKTNDHAPVTALVAAGRRPGVDALAEAFGTSDKALIEIAGRPMLAHVLDTLLSHPAIGQIHVLTQDPETLAAHPQVAALLRSGRVDFVTGGDSVSRSVADAITRSPQGFPYLMTTADHPLIDRGMIDFFIEAARESGADVATGVVSRAVFAKRFPDLQRTWLTFARGSYSGSNLFWFGSPAATRALDVWQTIEHDRKRGRAIIRAFGLPMLIGAALRVLTLGKGLELAGRKIGVRAVAIELPFAHACIDVDKPADHAIASAIFAQRAVSPA